MRWTGRVWNNIEAFVFGHLFLRFGKTSADELIRALWDVNRQPGGNRAKLSKLSADWQTRWMPDSAIFDTWYRTHWMPSRVDDVTRMIPARSRSLLDIGCGDGRLTAAIAEAWSIPPHRCVGLDVSFSRKSKTPTHFRRVTADVEREHVFEVAGERRFELVLLMQILHHLRNPSRLLEELEPALLDGGSILIRDHNVCSITDAIFMRFVDDFFFYVVQNSQGNLFTCYHSMQSWKVVLGAAGYRVVKEQVQGDGSLFRQFDLLAVRSQKR